MKKDAEIMIAIYGALIAKQFETMAKFKIQQKS